MQNNYIPLNPGSINGGSKPKKKLIIALIAVAVLGLLIWLGVSSTKKLIAETPEDRRQDILDAARSYYANNCTYDDGILESNTAYVKSVKIKDTTKVNDYINKGGEIPNSEDIFECATGLCGGGDLIDNCPKDVTCYPDDILDNNQLKYAFYDLVNGTVTSSCPTTKTPVPKPTTGDGSGDKIYIDEIYVTKSNCDSGWTSGSKAPDGKTKLCYKKGNDSTKGIDQFNFLTSCGSGWDEVLNKDGSMFTWEGKKLCYKKNSKPDSSYTSLGFANNLYYDSKQSGSHRLRWKCPSGKKIIVAGDGTTGIAGSSTNAVPEGRNKRDRGLRLCGTGGVLKKDSMPTSTPASNWDTFKWNDKKNGFWEGETVGLRMGIREEVAGDRDLVAAILAHHPSQRHSSSDGAATGFGKAHKKRKCDNPIRTVEFREDIKGNMYVWHNNYGEDDHVTVPYSGLFDSNHKKIGNCLLGSFITKGKNHVDAFLYDYDEHQPFDTGSYKATFKSNIM